MLHASSLADPNLGGSCQQIWVVGQWQLGIKVVLYICVLLLIHIIHALLFHLIFKHVILIAGIFKVIDKNLSETSEDFLEKMQL